MRNNFIIILILLTLPFLLQAQPYVSIYDFQTVAVGDDSSYMVGDTITTSGIVTAGAGLFYAGSHATCYLQDNHGGPFSGVLIYNDQGAAFANIIGDSVLVTGRVSEYYTTATGCWSNMTELVTIGEVMVLLPNRPLPEVMTITCGEIDSSNGADSLAEQYEGCLIRVEDVVVCDVSSPYRQFNVTDNQTGECIIRMYSYGDSIYQLFVRPPLGTPFESITGVCYQVYGNYTIMPRYLSDMVYAVGPPVISGTFRVPAGHPFSSDTTEVYTSIIDDSGIQEASVFYRVNGGNWNDVVLAPQGLIAYKAIIPPQANYSTVDYYCYALDDDDNASYDPPNAPAEFYTYIVSDSIPQSIYEVQFPEDSIGNSFFVHRTVQLEGVVTADAEDFPIDSALSGYQQFYFQDTDDPYSTGGEWNGIYIYNRADDLFWISAERGDKILLTAQVNEYYNMTELQEVTTCAVISSGNAEPTPIEIECADLSAGTTTGEPMEGCLVMLNDVTVVNPAVSTTLWSVTDASGDTCLIGTAGIYIYLPNTGDNISYLIGLVRYSSGSFKLEPRDDADVGDVSSVESGWNLMPDNFALKSTYPNPFNSEIRIDFTLQEKAPVKLEIYDLLGRMVMILADEPLEKGVHSVKWNGCGNNGKAVSSGIYFVRYYGESFDFSRKVVLMK